MSIGFELFVEVAGIFENDVCDMYGFCLESELFKIDMDRKKNGIILSQIHLVDNLTGDTLDVRYEFDQSFLPELIAELTYE